MSKSEDRTRMRNFSGVAHQGTEAFGNRVLNGRKKAKSARKARRKQRKK